VKAPETSILPFSNARATDYARAYCSGGNDCPDGTFPSDCAHFISHILAAGGAVLNGPTHLCAKGLATSAVELHSAFINASEIYQNVHVHRADGAQAGDFCFWLANLGSQENHAFLLSGPLDPAGGGPAYVRFIPSMMRGNRSHRKKNWTCRASYPEPLSHYKIKRSVSENPDRVLIVDSRAYQKPGLCIRNWRMGIYR
jgi:hypothetical protein